MVAYMSSCTRQPHKLLRYHSSKVSYSPRCACKELDFCASHMLGKCKCVKICFHKICTCPPQNLYIWKVTCTFFCVYLVWRILHLTHLTKRVMSTRLFIWDPTTSPGPGLHFLIDISSSQRDLKNIFQP